MSSGRLPPGPVSKNAVRLTINFTGTTGDRLRITTI
jgi:hypothetical protein